MKSTGLDDTPENRRRVKEWLCKAMERIEKGTFVFTEAFPGASPEEKALFSKLEGRDYKPDPADVLFGDYVADWKKRFLDRCQSQSKKRDQDQIIDYWLLPSFKGKTFQQITGVDLKEFVANLTRKKGKRAGEHLSASRVRNVLIPFRTIWFDAMEEFRWDLTDPFNYLKRHKIMPRRKKRTQQRYNVFRFDDWMATKEHMDPYYGLVAEIMIMTGMIGSEIAGLRKNDVLADRIMVRNSIVRNHEKQDLKTEYRERELPMTAALRERLDVAISRSKSEYVFPMKSGCIFDVDSFRKDPWTAALVKLVFLIGCHTRRVILLQLGR